MMTEQNSALPPVLGGNEIGAVIRGQVVRVAADASKKVKVEIQVPLPEAQPEAEALLAAYNSEVDIVINKNPGFFSRIFSGGGVETIVRGHLKKITLDTRGMLKTEVHIEVTDAQPAAGALSGVYGHEIELVL